MEVPLGPTRALLAEHHFLVTVGKADANPTTILEAMAWGLVPICTPESGYDDPREVINVPLDDVRTATFVLRRAISMDDGEYSARVRQNWRRLDEHYNWTRFGSQVVTAIREPRPQTMARLPRRTRVDAAIGHLVGPLAPVRPRNAVALARIVARSGR